MALIGGFLAAAVRVATPLLLAATGETVTERAGVINLGLEGLMLAGALAAALGATAGRAVDRHWRSAVLAGMLLAAVFAAVAIGARADQIIAGTAITLGAVGLTGHDLSASLRHRRRRAGAAHARARCRYPGLRRSRWSGRRFFDQPVADLPRAPRAAAWSGGPFFVPGPG